MFLIIFDILVICNEGQQPKVRSHIGGPQRCLVTKSVLWPIKIWVCVCACVFPQSHRYATRTLRITWLSTTHTSRAKSKDKKIGALFLYIPHNHSITSFVASNHFRLHGYNLVKYITKIYTYFNDPKITLQQHKCKQQRSSHAQHP